MMTRSWIRHLFARPVTRPIRKASHRFRPALEVLEDRWVPSTFTVNSTADLGTGSGLAGDLRYCINQANSAGGDETIVFDKTAFKTAQKITLTGTQLELTDKTGTETITAPKAGVTVSGGGLSRVFQVDGGVAATISGMTITGGSAANGGGLENLAGTVTLTNCTVSGNTASTECGGGLYTFNGTLSLTNCTVSGNYAYNAGGGLYSLNGTASLSKCTVTSNYGFFGGGVAIRNGTAKLTSQGLRP
jgi:fibronectin-binding autotransporter adhesin